MTPSTFSRWLRWAPTALLALCAAQGHAAVTDIATSPLQTSTGTLVKPNIFFVLDDSGSMYWDFMPDWVSSYTSSTTLVRNSRFNGVYYDPAVTYTPPVKYDGSSYTSMTSGNTSAWTKVPFDGFSVMTASGAPNTGTNNLFTSSNSGTTQDLTSGTAYYYTFIAGEYCTAANLRTCNTQSAATSAYPYPAYLRWCSTSGLTSCQAARIDTDPGTGVTYTYPRYPGVNSGAAGSNTKVTISAATSSYPYPGTTAKASTRTDCAGTTCSYTEEMTNFANWWAYYRTRMQMAKTASSIAMAALSTSYRLGYMSINNNTGSDFLNVLDITTTSTGQKSAWYSKLIAAKPTGGTSLRSALATAGQYYAGKLSKINGQGASDPMQYACQRNYTILTTDGYWNASSATPTQLNASTAIGDQDSGESRPQFDGTATANTLADVAEYYYATDLRTAALGNATSGSTGADVASNSYANGQQRMYTYTVGLGASGYMQYLSNYTSATSGDYYDVLKGTAASSSTLSSGVCSWQKSGSCNWPVPKGDTQTTIDDLWHTAVNGRGTFYSATNPSDLKAGLTNFINSVNAATSSAAAPTLSSVTLSKATSTYAFGVTFCAGKWFGDLARYSVDATTGAVSSTPDWSESGAGTDCTDSSATLATTPLLDRIAYDSRVIYTYDSSAGALIAFKWASLNSTMQGYFKVAAMASLSQMCSSGSTCLPTASQVDSSTAGTNTGAGGINLVNYLRGDRSNEGTANTAYYFPRTHVLGDIVNSQPLYVQAPLFSYADSGYAAFKSSNAGRQGMVYVNANDGMLHAISADTGVEAWAYLPSLVLPNLYKLADKNYASNHVYLNDGPLTQADVYYGGAWHTIIVGGLGAGGRGFYALDVTTPASPKILWEFTYDTSKSSPYISDADLGYAFGPPVVTKLSDGTWAVLVSSGYNNVSPGSGHGIVYVLNAKTGAIIKKIDDGVGTTTGGGTVSGCSAAPCPSGLAKIVGWLDSGSDNKASYVYGGDLYGNLWRFNISGLTSAGGTATAQSLVTLMDGNGTRQPITTRPELGLVSGQRVIYVGTGAYLGVSDISTTGTQSLYAIKDTLATSGSSLYGNPRANACSASAATGCFVRQILATSSTGSGRTATSTVGYPVNMATMAGWFEDLPLSGERVNVDPTLQEGMLIYVSNVPSTTGACSVGGSSYLNYVSYSTGLAASGVTLVGELLSSSGLGTSLTLYKTATGNTVGVGKLSTGATVTADPPDSPATTATRRVFWRELITDK